MRHITFVYLLFCIVTSQCVLAKDVENRGIDFRVQLNKGTLNFTSISDVQRTSSGNGSELATHLYLFEGSSFRSSVFLSSRVMSYTGQDTVEGQVDDLQVFTFAPGLELSYGSFFLQSNYQTLNVNNYWISSASRSKQYTLTGIGWATGFQYKFGHLGVGIGYSSLNIPVPASKLGTSQDSMYKENIISLNIIYYMGISPRKFFKELF